MTTHRLARAWAAALVASVVVLAGCGSSARTAGPPTPRSNRGATVGSCPKAVLGRSLQRIPATFHPYLAIECTEDTVAVPGKGKWLAEDQRRASRDLGPLVRALRRPDQPAPAGIACASVAVVPPEFLLVGAGEVIRPKVPTDECGQPQAAALSALRSLPWKLAHRAILRQMATPAEIASGCGPDYTDLFDEDAPTFVPAKTASLLPDQHGPLTICVYRDTDPADNHPDGTAIPGRDVEIGAFAGWTRQHGRAATALLAGLSHGRATTTCGRTHPAFATLSGLRWDPSVLVELGGCDRVLRIVIEPARPPGSRVSKSPSTTVAAATEVEEIGQAPPAVVARIRSLTRTHRRAR